MYQSFLYIMFNQICDTQGSADVDSRWLERTVFWMQCSKDHTQRPQNFYKDWYCTIMDMEDLSWQLFIHITSKECKTYFWEIMPAEQSSVSSCTHVYKFSMIFCSWTRLNLHGWQYRHKEFPLLGTAKSIWSRNSFSTNVFGTQMVWNIKRLLVGPHFIWSHLRVPF